MEMFCQYKLHPNNDLNMQFDDLLKKAKRLLALKKKLANFVQVEKKSPKGKDLVKKYDYQTCISFKPKLLVISLLA